MLSGIIPKFFFNSWFWMGIITIVGVVHYFWGKTPPPPKTSKFVTKHKKTITKIMNVGIICFVLLFCVSAMLFPITSILDAFNAPEQTRSTEFAFILFFIMMIVCSGTSALLLGLLSIFQSNITSIKRIILLVLCLLPVIFTIILTFLYPFEDKWLTIKLGLIFSFNCWIVNGPAIIAGKPFIKTMWNVMHKLRLVSGEYSE